MREEVTNHAEADLGVDFDPVGEDGQQAPGGLLHRVLTRLSDLFWERIVFRCLELLETPQPTPEQLRQQRLREREQAIAAWIETHRREEP
jgi:hypothetical protein